MTRIIPDLKIFLLLFFLSLLILTLDTFGFLKMVKSFAFYITNPISFGLYSTNQNIGRQFYFMFQARFAAQENKALKEQLAELISENANLRKQLVEKEVLTAQEDYLSFETYNLQAARPIGLGRYLKIDKGLNSGINLGNVAVFKDNYIGKVKVLGDESAQIQLLGDPDSKVAVFSQGLMGRAKGVLIGQFGTEILMDKILHEEKIASGDLVYSEGTEGNLPRGLVLGKITQVLERRSEVFKSAKVTPIFNTGDLDLIFIIKE
ncbi:MAG: rod shape-determining protein MreC [Nanoarchaeota archaeon]